MIAETDKQIIKFIDEGVYVVEIAKKLGMTVVNVYARISHLLHNKELREKEYENYKLRLDELKASSSKLQQDILNRMEQRISMRTIQSELDISYGKFQKIVSDMVKNKKISEDYYETYKRDVKVKEKFEKNKSMFDKMKSGLSPIHIAKTFDPPYTRQHVYMIIDWFVAEKFITLEEKINYLENAERIVSQQGIDKKKNKKIILNLVLENHTVDYISDKLGIVRGTVVNYMKELEDEGLITHKTYEKIATVREYNRIEKMVSILPKMWKDRKNNMSFQKISEKYEIALLTAFSYIKLVEKYNPETKKDYEKIIREKHKLSVHMVK